MAGELNKGMQEVIGHGLRNPNNAVTGQFSPVENIGIQASPAFRDEKIDEVQEQIQHPKENRDYQNGIDQRRGTLARAAALLCMTTSDSTWLRMREAKFDGRTGTAIDASKTRTEMRDQVAGAMLGSKHDLENNVFGRAFAGKEMPHTQRDLPESQRIVFIRSVPILAEYAKEHPDNKDAQEAVRFATGKLVELVQGGLDRRYVSEAHLDTAATEAMHAIIQIDRYQAQELLGKYLTDSRVDVGNKLDVIRQLPVEDIMDVERTLGSLRGVEEGDKKNVTKLERAVLDQVRGKASYGLHANNEQWVDVSPGIKKKAKDLSEAERKKVGDYMKVSVRAKIISLGWGGDTQLAQEALAVAMEATHFPGYGLEWDRTKIFDSSGKNGTSVDGASITIIKALPAFMNGKHIVDEEDFRLAHGSSGLEQQLAKLKLLKRENLVGDQKEKFERFLFGEGAYQILQLCYSYSTDVGKKLVAYFEAIQEIARKHPKKDRPTLSLSKYALNSALAEASSKISQRQAARIQKLASEFIGYY